jgi:hypothetical protein
MNPCQSGVHHLFLDGLLGGLGDLASLVNLDDGLQQLAKFCGGKERTLMTPTATV